MAESVRADAVQRLRKLLTELAPRDPAAAALAVDALVVELGAKETAAVVAVVLPDGPAELSAYLRTHRAQDRPSWSGP
ncbi:hypothetical protein FHX42_005212 [Saccharopolyspora lacisalsi]|uniref:Uncharacterized protein n=1 Tax=Halosaccharopolyspora lacisalsi TaxID=1000566 RepID=A0A839E7B9_9PSEU|nr:hypothetical protein [Halosaccharopolyspora lacisalsi]MBA8827805.1 hypothetical protein [Halosaccharopolyspora lacisalsi]